MKTKVGNLYRILVTEENRAKLTEMIATYKHVGKGSANLKHCAACLANDFFKLTSKQWNSSAGSEYYAAMLAVIVHFDLY
jgi:hypothetical protein